MAESPLLVLTRIWPTAERPSLGTFVRDRARHVPGLRRDQAALAALAVPAPLFAAIPRCLEGAWPDPRSGGARHRADRLRGSRRGATARGTAHRVCPWRRRAGLARKAAADPPAHTVHPPPRDRVVTNSEDTAVHIRQMGVEPMVSPPGVDLTRFPVLPRPAKRRVLVSGWSEPAQGLRCRPEAGRPRSSDRGCATWSRARCHSPHCRA